MHAHCACGVCARGCTAAVLSLSVAEGPWWVPVWTRGLPQVIVNELVQGLRNSEPPTELDPMEALVMAVDINAYVEEALDEASHDVWNPNSPIDDRAIHFPEFQRAVDRNPDFAINFTIPIVPPVVPTAVTKRARQTFNIVADLGGAGR
jgi:hypothetical protein